MKSMDMSVQTIQCLWLALLCCIQESLAVCSAITSDYTMCTSTVSRSEAALTCLNMGYRLIQPRTQTDYDYWGNYLQVNYNGHSVWAGAIWNTSLYAYTWETTSTPVPSSYFTSTLTTGICVSYEPQTVLLILSSNHEFQTKSCAETKYSLCEKLPVTTTASITVTTITTTPLVTIFTTLGVTTSPSVSDTTATTQPPSTTTTETTTLASTTVKVSQAPPTTSLTTSATATTPSTTLPSTTYSTTTALPATNSPTTAQPTTDSSTTALPTTISLTSAPTGTTLLPNAPSSSESTTASTIIDLTSTVLKSETTTPLPSTASLSTMLPSNYNVSTTTVEPPVLTQVVLLTNPPVVTNDSYTYAILSTTIKTTINTTINNNNTSNDSTTAIVYVTTTTTPVTWELCACGCPIEVPTGLELKEAFIEEVVKKIQQHLFVNSQNLSATIRKRTSADDERRSAQTVGYIGVVVLVVVFGSIILLDLTHCSVHSKSITSHKTLGEKLE